MSAPIQGSNANQALQISTINGFQVKEDPDGLLGFFFNGIEIGRINQQGDASFAAIGVNAGLGISVVGDTISNTGVVSINSSTGTTSITGGTGITVQGLNIINSGVTGIGTSGSPPYATGNVKFLGGTGVSIVNSATTVIIGITSTTGVSSVSSPNDSLSIAPTTGAVYADLNGSHANTWYALQTFGNYISFGGAQLAVSGLTAGEVLYYNGTNWINREVSSTALSSLNGLTGAVTLASSTNTLEFGVAGQTIDIEINPNQPITWTALQTFGNNISFGGAQVVSSTLAAGDVLYFNGTTWVNTPLGQAGVTSIKSSDNTISVSSSTGAVDIGIDLAHANVWSGLQTFGNDISFGGAQVLTSSLTSGQVLYYNGTNWVNETPSSFGVESVDSLKGIISLASPNSSISIGTTGQTINFDINTNNSNDWAGIQTFSGSTTYFTNKVQAGNLFVENNLYINSTTDIFNTAYTWGALQTFNNNISFGGAQVNITTLASGDILYYNGSNWTAVKSSTIGGVTSVSNADGSITVSPNTGAVVVSLNLNHPNTWTSTQTFNAGITGTGDLGTLKPGSGVLGAFIAGTGISISNTGTTDVISNAGVLGIGGSTTAYLTGNVKFVAGTDINITQSGQDITITNTSPAGVTSIKSSTGTLTFSSSTGTVDAEINLNHENTWATTQTFGGISVTGVASLPTFLSSTHTWSAVQTFGNNISIGGAKVNVTSLSSSQILEYDGTNWVNTTVTGLGLVDSVQNNDGSLTISPTTGAVVASLNLNHSNIWTTTQTFEGNPSIFLTGKSINYLNFQSTQSGAPLWSWASGYDSATSISLVNLSATTPIQAILADSNGDITINGNMIIHGSLTATSFIGEIDTATLDGISFAFTTLSAGEVLYYNGTNWINREISSTALSSLNGLTGAVTIESTTGELTVGTSGQNISVNLNLAHENTWSTTQTFGSLTANGIVDIPAFLSSTHTWSALQTFGNNISFGGVQLNVASLVSGQVLSYNGTNWVNATTATAGVSSVTNTDGTLTISPTTGNVVASLNLAHENTWSTTQTFSILDATTINTHTINATTMVVTTTQVQDITVSGAFKLTGTVDVPINATLTTNGGTALGVNLSSTNTWINSQTFDSTIITNVGGSETAHSIADSSGNWYFDGYYGFHMGSGYGTWHVWNSSGKPVLQVTSDTISTPHNSIVSYNNTLDDGSGNMLLKANSDTTNNILHIFNGGMSIQYNNANNTMATSPQGNFVGVEMNVGGDNIAGWYENYNAMVLAVYNQGTSTNYGLDAGKYTVPLIILRNGAIGTYGINQYSPGSNTLPNGDNQNSIANARNILDDGSGNLTTSGNITSNGSITSNNAINSNTFSFNDGTGAYPMTGTAHYDNQAWNTTLGGGSETNISSGFVGLFGGNNGTCMLYGIFNTNNANSIQMGVYDITAGTYIFSQTNTMVINLYLDAFFQNNSSPPNSGTTSGFAQICYGHISGLTQGHSYRIALHNPSSSNVEIYGLNVNAIMY